jgi:hypothetical protein
VDGYIYISFHVELNCILYPQLPNFKHKQYPPNDVNFLPNNSLFTTTNTCAYKHNFAFQKFATFKKGAKAGPTLQNGGYMI